MCVVCDCFCVVAGLFWIRIGRLFVFVVVIACIDAIAASSLQYCFLLLLLCDSVVFDHGIVICAASGLIALVSLSLSAMALLCLKLILFDFSGQRRRRRNFAAALRSFTGHLQLTMVLLFVEPWF